jgi:hypothetical protein
MDPGLMYKYGDFSGFYFQGPDQPEFYINNGGLWVMLIVFAAKPA